MGHDAAHHLCQMPTRPSQTREPAQQDDDSILLIPSRYLTNWCLALVVPCPVLPYPTHDGAQICEMALILRLAFSVSDPIEHVWKPASLCTLHGRAIYPRLGMSNAFCSIAPIPPAAHLPWRSHKTSARRYSCTVPERRQGSSGSAQAQIRGTLQEKRSEWAPLQAACISDPVGEWNEEESIIKPCRRRRDHSDVTGPRGILANDGHHDASYI